MINFFDALGLLVKPIWAFLGSHPFLLFAVTVSLLLKTGLLILFAIRGLRTSKLSIPLTLLLLVLIGGMAEDVAWIARLLQKIFYIKTNIPPLFLVRIAWAFFVIRYQALALFIQVLTDKKFKLKLHQIPFLIVSAGFAVFFIVLNFLNLKNLVRHQIEFKMMEAATFYTTIPLILTALTLTLLKLRSTRTPRIIRKQLKVLIRYLVLPTVIADFIQSYPFYYIPTLLTHTYSVVGISTIALTCTIYYSARKVMGLRFLNLYEHVRSPKGFNFMKDFKNVLEQFSLVTNERELNHITQSFFKDAFRIPIRRTHLHIRAIDKTHSQNHLQKNNINTETSLVENFISAHNNLSQVGVALKKQKIFITDEMAFNNFYEKNEIQEKILTFLININADIFIPVYDKETLVGYIVIERYARSREADKNTEFYSNVDRDQMVVFATYLGNIIHLLHNRNLNTIIAQQKELHEELYDKHQKINQYKESIRSFMRTNKQRKIGIIFYKNRKFTFGNQTAQELIQVNINTHEGHPISKVLKRVAVQALEYKSQQTSFTQDEKGNRLVVSAIPNIEQNNVIITVYYPEISDILKKKIELLSDPTKWDYLLYLETTKSGKLIDQLIPGTSETILNFKIDLLKIALSKKAILLDMPQEDLIPTVELLHHISLRRKLHILQLQSKTSSIETASKLFGINPIFGLAEKQSAKPLLEKLNGIGTLFIQNIHYLDLETQEYLAEFLRYGMYRTFKSDQKQSSNVRIICSTNKNLQEMTQEGTFNKDLFNELNKTQLTMPSLITLSEEELKDLATGFSEQAIKTEAFKNLFELTDKEKRKLTNAKPTSLQELKIRVQQLLSKKTQKNEICEETQFDPAYNISDPELIEAARLGKHALKDPKIMTMLWNKFKNQNKIASFLGVNRSSVNRRCKEYSLIP